MTVGIGCMHCLAVRLKRIKPVFDPRVLVFSGWLSIVIDYWGILHSEGLDLAWEIEMCSVNETL